jgi:hypothetical protein
MRYRAMKTIKGLDYLQVVAWEGNLESGTVVSILGRVSEHAKWVEEMRIIKIEDEPSWYGEFIGGDPLLKSGEIYLLDSDDALDPSEPDYYISAVMHGGQYVSKNLFKQPYKVYKILGPCGHYH